MFGGPKKWSERKVAPKNCRNCQNPFSPTCGGNIYCPICKKEIRRKKHADGQKKWRAKNFEKHAIHKTKWDLKRFGLSMEQYTKILSTQKNSCAICHTADPGGKGIYRKFAVDHDHTTGKMRGLLCHKCNLGISFFKDNPEILRAAIQYLEEST